MNGVRAINNRKIKGSTTVEAAIVMHAFLIVLFSLAYIIRVFYTYNTVQASLSEVARNIANMSYFYHVSGAKGYVDRLNDMAREAGSTLAEQKSTIIDAFGSFNDLISGEEVSTGSLTDIDSLLNQLQNMSDTSDAMQTIISDPKSELKLFMKVFVQKLSYEVTNKLVCLIARHNLGAELKKRVSTSKEDAALALGIKDGIKGINFDESSIFGDSESLEFVVQYSVKAPIVFAFTPEFRLSNRVKIIAWTGGRGNSVKVSENGEDKPETGSSIWNEMDKNKQYCDRGLEIEDQYIKKLMEDNKVKGVETFFSSEYPGIDAYTYNKKTGVAECYDVFSLNPFLKTYSQRPSAIANEIKKHGKRLLECEVPGYFNSVLVSKLRRVVVIVIPENSESYADEAYFKAKKELEKYNIEVELVRGFGQYHKTEENEGQANAA